MPICLNINHYSVQTLPDLLNQQVQILSIGLNPSLPSVREGFYFANPRNRFWKALNNSGLSESPVPPSLAGCQQLLEQFHIGMTDLVKRPTAGCKDLKAADYRLGAVRLIELIHSIKPSLIWIHGKLTCQKFLQYQATTNNAPPSAFRKGISDIAWGAQDWQINNTPVYISPNPSPANAAYSLTDISDSYQALLAFSQKIIEAKQ